jgi:hypothetical protein
MSNFGVRRSCRRFNNSSRNENRIAEPSAPAVHNRRGAALLRPISATDNCPCYDPSLHFPKLKPKN